MPVCENGLIAKLLSELDAAGLQEQWGLTLRWVLFTRSMLFKKAPAMPSRLYFY